jgi:hypothetical protein
MMLAVLIEEHRRIVRDESPSPSNPQGSQEETAASTSAPGSTIRKD